ncbi:hypothetical protein F4779DRAFT_622661 [Xylariaceae sp. FL0662B]|nr:hypothetical protein F4779DRAFT_622661 [Xylariaceae sp. FL0662B]
MHVGFHWLAGTSDSSFTQATTNVNTRHVGTYNKPIPPQSLPTLPDSSHSHRRKREKSPSNLRIIFVRYILYPSQWTMSTTYPGIDPAVAVAMEASATLQVRIIGSIVLLLAVGWVLLAAFFWFHFCKPIEKSPSEDGIELQDIRRATEVNWWGEQQ